MNANTAVTESYNGTSWTEANDLKTGRQALGEQGTYTAAIATGGEPPGIQNKTEKWNGSNWTSGKRKEHCKTYISFRNFSLDRGFLYGRLVITSSSITS